MVDFGQSTYCTIQFERNIMAGTFEARICSGCLYRCAVNSQLFQAKRYLSIVCPASRMDINRLVWFGISAPLGDRPFRTRIRTRDVAPVWPLFTGVGVTVSVPGTISGTAFVFGPSCNCLVFHGNQQPETLVGIWIRLDLGFGGGRSGIPRGSLCLGTSGHFGQARRHPQAYMEPVKGQRVQTSYTACTYSGIDQRLY